MFCKECGANIPEGAKFCKECGTPVKVVNITSEKVGNDVKASTTVRDVLTTVKKPSGNYSVKPNIYNSNVERKLKSEVESLKQICKNGVSNLEYDYEKEKDAYVKSTHKKITIARIAVPVGLFLLTSIASPLFPVLVGSIILAVVLPVILELISFDKLVNNKYDNDNKPGLNSKIASMEEAYRSDVMKANEKAEKDKKKYKEGFDAEVLEMSTLFATSDLLAKIVDKMTDKFKREIASLNRATNLEKVGDSFKVNVFTNKVTSNAGTFDFNVERYKSLNSIVEVCGLAKAIQSALYLNMTMECPEDPSGTAAVYSVTEDDDSFVIDYSAINGNYVSVKEW